MLQNELVPLAIALAGDQVYMVQLPLCELNNILYRMLDNCGLCCVQVIHNTRKIS